MSSTAPTPLYFRQQRAILCWPGDTQISLPIDGEIVYVPPVSEAYTAQDRVKHRFLSATDEQGHPIPGTVELHDLTWYDDQEMVEKRTFDTNAAVTMIFGKDGAGQSGIHKEYCKKGLRLASTPGEARQALDDGRRVWEKVTVDSAHAILFRRGQVLEDAATRGHVPAPEGPEVKWAASVMKAAVARGYKRDEVSRDEIKELLSQYGGSRPSLKAEPVTTGKTIQEERLSPEDERKIQADDLIESCRAASIALTPSEVKAIAAGDEKAIRAAQVKIVAAEAQG